MTPAAIAERRHPFIAITHKVPLLLPSAQKAEMKADPASHIAKLEELKGQKQMLMYGHVDLPTENFSFKWESGAPQCEDGCAFQDKVFTVEVIACEKDASRCVHREGRGAGAKCSIQPACTQSASLFSMASRIHIWLQRK